MEQTVTKLWNKNLILVAIGQIISLFGSEILRFALPLYILYLTDSAALFGTVAALSFLPAIIIAPMGGILADRINKKRIMVILDFTTAFFIVLYIWASGFLSIIPITIIILMGLFAIQGIMSPTIDSSVPLIVPKDELVRGNAVIMMINTLSGMIGPAIGGVLFASFGIMPLLYVSSICFALAATMEIFIRIPSTKQKAFAHIGNMVKSDLKDSFHFITKKKPLLLKLVGIICVLSMLISPILLVGLPVLITQNLGLDSQFFGYAKAVSMVGGLVGGLLAGSLGKKLGIQKSHITLLITGLSLFPIGLAFLLNLPTFTTYIIILIFTTITMAGSTLFNIQLFSYIQLQTPVEVLGKIIALITALAMSAQPLGFLLYGFLFEVLAHIPWVIIFGALAVGIVVIVYATKTFQDLP
ncbi:MAG: MFS transporter [Lachnospiraceae bacterium]|nr:MFS transporter [Lachnospiraceae bacterium]